MDIAEKKRMIKVRLNGSLKRRVLCNNILMLFLACIMTYISIQHAFKPINVYVTEHNVTSIVEEKSQTPPIELMTHAAVTVHVHGLMIDSWYPYDPNGNPNYIEVEWFGSGVLVDNLGTIITAEHVVNHAISIVVIDYNGNKYEAEEWDHTEYADLGIIKIRPQPPLPVVSLAIDNPKVGDTIYICGSSLGEFTNSLSRGIVGHTERLLTDLGYTKPVFQTDASAYPGNSGGPVYNEDGLLVGILVAGVDSGMDFAVPVDQVRAFYDLYWAGRKLRDME